MIIIAHNIRSLHNVGAIFRSADAFSIDKVYLTGYTGQPPRAEIAKVALGGEQRVPWEYHEDIEDILHQLKDEEYQILALETSDNAVDLAKFEPNEKSALILGNEVEGIEPSVLEKTDEIVMISMPGAKRSLNVSVAAGIAMFSLTQK